MPADLGTYHLAASLRPIPPFRASVLC